MVPKAPIVLGILCAAVLIVGTIGVNSSKEISEFMGATPLQNKIKADSKILFEINELTLKYQENNEDKKINEQRVLMEEKIIEIARESFGTDNITMIEILQSYFPLVKGSQVDMRGNEKTFPICDVAENIPAHLQKISNAEMFQIFFNKYSKNEMVLNIQDERSTNSSFHYGLQAISDDGKFVASTFFHADSCTNEITDFDKFHLNCLDKQNKEGSRGTNNPDYIVASLELEEFCTIPLSPRHQKVSDYKDTISEKIHEEQEKTISVEIQSLEDAMRFQSEVEQWVLLSHIAGNIVQDYLEDENTQDMIKEYNEKYGDLPDGLLNLLDARPSPPESNKEEKYSQALVKINQLGLKYQNNDDSKKFNEQMLLMQEKQKEVASNILGINLSNVYVDSPYNFPFGGSSNVRTLDLESQFDMCGIPENIPLHLQTIKDSEMFHMFSEKYSHYPLELIISDERSFESTVHYTLSATSEDEKYRAGTYFHINSCTGESAKGYINLHCNNESAGDSTHAFLLENIVMSLEDEEFCTISFMPWQEKLFEYSENISNEIKKMNQKMMDEDMPPKDMDDAMTRVNDMEKASLLSQIIFEATHNLDDDFLKNSDLVIEYREKFGDLPKKLQELIEQRPIIEQ